MNSKSASLPAGAQPVVDRIAPSEMMDPRAAAEYIGTKPATLAVWRCTNRVRLPWVKVGGRCRYRKSDLDKFIEENLKCAA